MMVGESERDSIRIEYKSTTEDGSSIELDEEAPSTSRRRRKANKHGRKARSETAAVRKGRKKGESLMVQEERCKLTSDHENGAFNKSFSTGGDHESIAFNRCQDSSDRESGAFNKCQDSEGDHENGAFNSYQETRGDHENGAFNNPDTDDSSQVSSQFDSHLKKEKASGCIT